MVTRWLFLSGFCTFCLFQSSVHASECDERLARIAAIKLFLGRVELDPRSRTYRHIASLVRRYEIGTILNPDRFLDRVTADDLIGIAGDPELTDTFWRQLVEESEGFRNSLIDQILTPAEPGDPALAPVDIIHHQ